MGNYEKIGNIAEQGDAPENDDIEAGKIKGGFWLERYINKQNGSVEKMFIKNDIGDVVEFVDLEVLRKSEPFHDFIKAHYLNEGIVLKDDEVKKAVESLADVVSYNILNNSYENKKIES